MCAGYAVALTGSATSRLNHKFQPLVRRIMLRVKSACLENEPPGTFQRKKRVSSQRLESQVLVAQILVNLALQLDMC